jgi:hypothetical protein
MAEPMRVTSHVGRDLLASATAFKTEAAVVWEYVANSLQYVDEGVAPCVQVAVRPKAKRIEVIDNGSGMTEQDLNRFFQMHAENRDRLRGKLGRGRWGTGKAAAFGIANTLCVDTVRDHVRNVVRLNRAAIEASAGEDIDVEWVVRNEESDYANGTTVAIEDIVLPRLNAAPITEYVERHLQAFRGFRPKVAINDHICEYREPTVVSTHAFRPSEEQIKVLGDAELTVKVSQAPLPRIEQGITVTAGPGNLLAIETVGIETKELGNYLFGSIDVPALETSESPIAPIDVSRSLELNPQHPVARVLLPFLGSSLEEVRKLQVQKLREEQKTEEARRLASQADKIATFLNEDFSGLLERLHDIRSASARPGSLGALHGSKASSGGDIGVWVEGTSMPGSLLDEGDGGESDLGAGGGGPEPAIAHEGRPDDSGTRAVDPAGGTGKKQKRPQGGFRVRFRHLGNGSGRSAYDRTEITIFVNLDHPAVRNALQSGGGSVESASFVRLAYEVAFTEYAVAVGSELADRDPDIPADDLIFEIHSTLDRVTAAAAAVYR